MAKRMTVVFDDEELYTAIKVEAARRHVAAKDIVTDALKDWLQLQDDIEDAADAAEAMAEYEREGGIPIEDILRERGLSP